MSETPKPIAINSVIWEKCVEKKWEIKIRGRVVASWTLNGCVRLIEDGGTIYVELQIEGERARFALTNTCFPLRYTIFTLEGCFSNIVFENNRPKSFDVVINACIDVGIDLGFPIGRVGIKECVELYRQKISLFFGQTVDTLSYVDEIIGTVAYFEGNP
ncbi:MAG: hypothetical protein DWQ51_01690 [Microcystis wesenbergii TW10]|uniref:Uncharacterized protein n=1 Tax=Microcystis wesenbergii TW10 TaxID=2060474 RepID=A0A3E0MEZ9_9CHRO|nr:MAG: hypothetical protein DWQ51_01690 [Microcystis wesenbergii TW10]